MTLRIEDRGESRLFVGTDTALGEGCLAALQRALAERSDAAAVGAAVQCSGAPVRALAVDLRTGRLRAVEPPPLAVAEVSGTPPQAVLVRRAALDAVGPVDASVSDAWAVMDFEARAIRRGWRVYHARNALATRGEGDDGLDDARGRAWFAARHLGAVAAARSLAAHPAAVLEALSRERAGTSYRDAVRMIEMRGDYYGRINVHVVEAVPAGARRVVDVGCGGGAHGRELKRRHAGMEVRGVEIMPVPAARAAEVLDDVHIGGAEDGLPGGWPAPDCVIFADVLEHLFDPWTVLRRWKAALAPGGVVVVSLPNIAHESVLRGLARARFDYQDAGILDRTHVRFFTRRTALELVEQAGLEVVRLDRAMDRGPVRRALLRGRFRRELAGQIPRGDVDPAGIAADLCTVQFVMVAR